ncbi:L-rhamnose mutarotase [Humibacter sp.]|jgi:L-rhamnose mutarotase|uniref:L-rhamnose mutarotase n=1 Tax=Humibacter sp. TaxID=1940291 RepID=UPI002BF430AA|nr:L-rhamnose mutarotase [Humibacter sp.]HVX09397.1 L-rhamnose mutarotase [Humibacter sp.]
MRIALHSTLRAGAADAYLAEHARVPDEVRALFDRAGIRDWTIWRSGDRLFHLVECDDFDEAMRVIRADEADRRWQERIGRFVDGFRGPDGTPAYAPLEQVWRLEEQRRDDAASVASGAEAPESGRAQPADASRSDADADGPVVDMGLD